MKNLFLLLPILLAAALPAPAQLVNTGADVLGAHMNYGRGCVACHATHSGSLSNGTAQHAGSGDVALWGVDAGQLYGQTIATGGGKYVEVLPSGMDENRPDASGILTCLSCHDGNYASATMMRNTTYESLPSSYGMRQMPTLLGRQGPASYLHDHPLGLNAKLSCGGSHWDCSIANGEVRMKGPNSSRFVRNYGFFVKPGVYNNSAVITCTTCHQPHMMNVVNVTNAEVSGMPAGTYRTMFFLRGPYNPTTGNNLSNQSAQFCRQCHADLSNEVNGSSAGTTF